MFQISLTVLYLFAIFQKGSKVSTPPTFIWFGEEDNAVIPEDNSNPYYNKLKNSGVFCEKESFKEVGHGAGLAEGTNAESRSDHAAEFFNIEKISEI